MRRSNPGSSGVHERRLCRRIGDLSPAFVGLIPIRDLVLHDPLRAAAMGSLSFSDQTNGGFLGIVGF
jgi:hypothetical protein